MHFLSFFFFNDPATTEIYTLSLHDALPILPRDLAMYREYHALLVAHAKALCRPTPSCNECPIRLLCDFGRGRSEEHTSELQSQFHLVCRLLLEKKKLYIDHHVLSS